MNRRLSIAMLVASLALMATPRVEAKNTATHSPIVKIVGGKLLRPGEYPSLAALVTNLFEPFCTGTLVADRWVLTARHCLNSPNGIIGPNDYLVVLGQSREHGQRLRVERELFFPDANVDIMLLKLRSPTTRRAAPLSSHPPNIGDTLTAVGWGIIDWSDPAAPQRARKLNLTVFQCPTPRPAYIFCVTTRALRGIAFGDSGGAIYRGAPGKPTIIGVVSQASRPPGQLYATYVKASHIYDWVQQTISQQ